MGEVEAGLRYVEENVHLSVRLLDDSRVNEFEAGAYHIWQYP